MSHDKDKSLEIFEHLVLVAKGELMERMGLPDWSALSESDKKFLDLGVAAGVLATIVYIEGAQTIEGLDD